MLKRGRNFDMRMSDEWQAMHKHWTRFNRFQKKIPKCNSMRGLQGFWGVKFQTFFIPRYKFREFVVPRYKFLHSCWVQCCIICSGGKFNFFYLNFHTNFIPDCLSPKFYPESDSSQSQGIKPLCQLRQELLIKTPNRFKHRGMFFQRFAIFPRAGMGFDNQ